MMADTGSSYTAKLDESMKKATETWFKNLSKVELLQFMQDRPDLTADAIRGMLEREHVVFGFGIQYDVANNTAVADFGETDQ